MNIEHAGKWQVVRAVVTPNALAHQPGVRLDEET